MRSRTSVRASGVIGAGVLALAVEEQAVHLIRQVVVMGDVALRAPAVVQSVEASFQAAPMTERAPERAQPGGAEIAAEQVEEIVERRAVLDGERAVHPGFAGMQAGIECQFPVQLGVVQPDRDGRCRPGAEDVAPAGGIDDREPSDPNQRMQYP